MTDVLVEHIRRPMFHVKHYDVCKGVVLAHLPVIL